MLSCFTNDTEHIKNLYLQRRAGGYIILSPTTNDYELLRTLHDIDAPFISTTSVTFAEGQKPFHVPYVDIDNYTAAVMAMEHLVGLGHQRIAFLATNENTSRQGKLASILLRQKAYTDTLAAHSIAVEPQRIVVAASNDVEEDYRTAYTLFSDQPELTAVFCATDLLAIGALKAIKDLGRTVPGDVSLVGFDGIPWARFTDPPLTTVGQDTFSRGRKTAAKLLDYLEKETPMTNEICAAELILVASTAMVK